MYSLACCWPNLKRRHWNEFWWKVEDHVWTLCFPVWGEIFLKEGLSSEKRESLSRSLYKMSHLFRQAETSSSEAVCFNVGRSIRLRLLLPHMEVFFSHEVLHFACIFTTALLGPWPVIFSFCGLGPLHSAESSHVCLQCCRCFKSTGPPVCSYCIVAALSHPPWC